MNVINISKKGIGKALLAVAVLTLLLSPVYAFAETDATIDEENTTMEDSVVEDQLIDADNNEIQSRAGTASKLNTWKLDGSNHNWKTLNDSGDMIGNKKETDKKTFSVYVSQKTMWSSPFFRLVNKNNSVRSQVLTLNDENKSFAGENYGSKDGVYYASLKPASSQVGEDTITLKFNPQ